MEILVSDSKSVVNKSFVIKQLKFNSTNTVTVLE